MGMPWYSLPMAQFEAMPPLLHRMNSKSLLFDGRRQLDKESMVRYVGIGI
jgi:hypothetical protein